MRASEVQQAITTAKSTQQNMTARGTADNRELGKQDFLNLLMTQLANQDPTDPMKPEQMMQQMASLGTVEQLQNLNAQTQQVIGLQKQIARASASSLLGRDVEVGSTNLSVQSGVTQPVSFKLQGDAEQVAVHVFAPEGDLVRRVDLKARGMGEHQFVWDGLDGDGDTMPDGSYRFDVVAKTADNGEVPVAISKTGTVAGVRFDSEQPLVQINGEWIVADKIMGMSNLSERRFGQATPLPLKEELLPASTLVELQRRQMQVED
ncbi:MAG: flagellar hook assembly protein FlgD [SAR324 cluster bacterium]|nr:flagellar hook assembly protein FlgD [SAR324 cluster bacterium]